MDQPGRWCRFLSSSRASEANRFAAGVASACFGRLLDETLIVDWAVDGVAAVLAELLDVPPTLNDRAVEPRFTLLAVIVELLAFEIVPPRAR